MANINQMEVFEFIRKLTAGKGADRVFYTKLGVNPLPTNYKVFVKEPEIFEDMVKTGVNVRLVYGIQGLLSCALFVINNEKYRIIPMKKNKMLRHQEETCDNIESFAVLDGELNVLNPKDTPFKDLKKSSVVKYLNFFKYIDAEAKLYKNSYNPYSLVIMPMGYTQDNLPSFDLAEIDQEELNEKLWDFIEKFPVIPIYKNGEYSHVMVGFDYHDGSSKYHKVYIEDKQLKSDVDIYSDEIARTVKFNELINFLLSLEGTKRVKVEVAKIVQPAIVKGFGK